MAHYSISKRENKNGNVYYARVREKEKGVVTFSRGKSFHSKSAAVKWAKSLVRKVEHNSDETDPDLVDIKLGELIQKYIERKQNSEKPMGRTVVYTLEQVCRYSIAKMLVTKIKSKDIVNFALERRNSPSNPSPTTISIDISCIRKVLRIAKSIFGICITDRPVIDAYPALHDLRLIARSNKRERRLKSNEFELILEQLKRAECHHSNLIPLSDIFQLSIITCLRVGEISELRWQDLDYENRTIVVRNRKNPNGSLGNNSLLPLLGESLGIIERQPEIEERIFPYNPRSITASFRRIRKRLGIEDLRYHDLRREGASRLIEQGYSVEEAARVTGHKDLNVLWQVYVQIHPSHFVT